jgi:translation initiation factor 2B subunit (eIF-2B alpha/beta/delta family)
LLRKLYDILRQIMDTEPAKVTDASSRIDQVRGALRTFKERRAANLDKLAQNGVPFLLDGGAILLFGFSQAVLRALEGLPSPQKAETPVYVLECRSKSRMNMRGQVIYCDGEAYAVAVKKAGFKKVHLVPDVVVANLIARRKVAKVLLGANGVDPVRGDFGHTAGHLTVTNIAQGYGVPVYVLVDSDKFGPFDPTPNAERTEAWFSETEFRLLSGEDIQHYNPREDVIGIDQTTMIITDRGAFPPSWIPTDLVPGRKAAGGAEHLGIA